MKVIIQDEIRITKQEVDKVIKLYETTRSGQSIGIIGWSGNAQDIIKEIKKLSEVGKSILLMNHRFEKWKKTDEYKKLKKEVKKDGQ